MEVVKVRLLVRMPEIQAMFNATDHQQIKEQNVALDAWLWRFRSVVEEQRTPSMSWSTTMEGEARPQGLQDKVGHAVQIPHFVKTQGDIQCHGCC